MSRRRETSKGRRRRRGGGQSWLRYRERNVADVSDPRPSQWRRRDRLRENEVTTPPPRPLLHTIGEPPFCPRGPDEPVHRPCQRVQRNGDPALTLSLEKHRRRGSHGCEEGWQGPCMDDASFSGLQ